MTDIHRIDEHPGAGRLGRHIQHDPRSRRYALDTTGVDIVSVRHRRNTAVFDQGDLGSCTGNAAVGTIATDPLFGQLGDHPNLDEALAVKVYTAATTLDDDPDTYPPTDTGSTGLAAAKALQQMGLITAYAHTFTFEGMQQALVLGPVMFGTNWYSSFDAPAANGVVKISRGAQIRGGHEIYADEIDVAAKLIGFTNSWGTGWALAGRFYMGYATVERLLGEQGDVTVPVPSSTPVPGPCGPSGVTGPTGPTPTGPSGSSGPSGAGPDDITLWNAFRIWGRAKGLS